MTALVLLGLTWVATLAALVWAEYLALRRRERRPPVRPPIFPVGPT